MGCVLGWEGRETGGKELGQEKRRGRMAQNDGERHSLSVTNLPDPWEEGRERAMELIITRPPWHAKRGTSLQVLSHRYLPPPAGRTRR